LTVPVAISLLPYKNEGIGVWRAVTIYGKRIGTRYGDKPGQQNSWAKRESCTRFATAKSSPRGKIRLPLEKSVAIIKH
jgi:hypothetical protein